MVFFHPIPLPLQNKTHTQLYLPSLVEINHKYYIVTETCQSMRCWHGDNECKNIIYKCVESLKKKKEEKWTKVWQNKQNDLCTQIRLRSAWASAQSNHRLHYHKGLGPLATHKAHSKNSDQTEQMPRLSCLYGRIGRFVCCHTQVQLQMTTIHYFYKSVNSFFLQCLFFNSNKSVNTCDIYIVNLLVFVSESLLLYWKSVTCEKRLAKIKRPETAYHY